MKALLTLVVSTLAVVAIYLTLDRTSASSVISGRPVSIENYDIRTDASEQGRDLLARLRGPTDPDAAVKTSDPRFKTEFNPALGVVEIVAPLHLENGERLVRNSGDTRADSLKRFVDSNRDLFGFSSADRLRITADYKNPDGNLGFAHLEQVVDGIPVFGAEIKAGFTRSGDMFRVINYLAPGVDARSVAKDFGSAGSAIVNAASHVGVKVATSDLNPLANTRPNELRFSSTFFSDTITSERYYFPVGNGVVRPAWRVLLWTDDERAYYVVVDAVDGTLLWRKNLTEEQTLSATYNVYGNSTSFLKTADSPSPFSPGCMAPTGCAQPPAVPRTTFTLIGNEAPYGFNNLGWVPDTGLPVRTPANNNITDGNNVEAGIDRIAPTGVDDNGWAFGNPTRVFNFSYNPAPGMPPPGEEPLPPGPQPYPPTPFQQGVITQGFYTINRWHDEMYRLGFTEQAGNFQHFNFGRGGSEGDRITYEIQDISSTNGANFSTPADGGRPRMQMFIWTGSTPDRDGALDGTVVLHEVTHGLTNRLHGNVTGLGSNMSRGMGEGWSDFYALAMLSEPSDDRLGTHVVGGYVTFHLLGGTPPFEANYYYGLRRFPTAVWASRGPNGLPHNPLTWRYVNNDCNTLIGTTTSNPNSAYPRGPIGALTCDQIHNLGELWNVTLWEVRDQLIARRGGAEGNRRVLQYVTDGMKLSPLNPTVIQSRDAILAAAMVSDAGDVAPVWRGFSIRGLGSGAVVVNAGSGNNNTIVTESFDIPGQFRRRLRADFDGDGRSDISVFRPSDRIWYLNRSTSGFAAINWGLATDELVPEDYDGDGKTDVAVFRASGDGATPDYYILKSSDSTVQFVSWGTTGDVPVSEDFDGDGKGDPAVFRQSTGEFWARRSSDGSIVRTMPITGGLAIAGDFDGDRKGDFATYSDGFWRILRSETGYTGAPWINWGTNGDKIVHGDYDGDGVDDLAVYRPSNGTWYISQSTGGNRILTFGISTDIPVPADYDGDGRTDIAVYRDGVWYIDGSTSGVVITRFGLAGDNPLQAAYLP